MTGQGEVDQRVRLALVKKKIKKNAMPAARRKRNLKKNINKDPKTDGGEPRGPLKQLTIGNGGLWQLYVLKSHLCSKQMG